jgi:predicted transposase/invertase (TIGR01784 family)
VQLIDQKNMVPRTLFYWSKLFTEGFEAGSNYKILQKTVAINILGFNMEQLRDESFHSTYQLHEGQSKGFLSDLLEIHFIETEKFAENGFDLNNPLHRWLLFLTNGIPDNLMMEVTNMDVIINKAEQKLQKLSADPETRREYEQRAKALSDERSRMEDSIEIGMEKGMESGILKVAKSFLASGMSLTEVAKHTPYSVEELRKMLNENSDGA